MHTVKHKSRRIKIQPETKTKPFTQAQTVPKLLIKGQWFEKAGFTPGMLVEVIVENGKLIIEECQGLN